MIQDVLAVLIGLGAGAAALVAITTALRLVGSWRPVRWLGHTFIGDPIGGAVRGLVRATLDDWAAERIDPRLTALEAQYRPNGGNSARDRLEAIAETVGAPPPPG